MFKAKIKSIQNENDFRDSVSVDVTFYNEEKEFTKNYKFHLSNFKTTEDVQKFIQSECEALDSFTAMVELIKPLMDKEDVVKEFDAVVAEEKLIAEEKIAEIIK